MVKRKTYKKDVLRLPEIIVTLSISIAELNITDTFNDITQISNDLLN